MPRRSHGREASGLHASKRLRALHPCMSHELVCFLGRGVFLGLRDRGGYYWEVAYADSWEFDGNDMLVIG